MSLVTWMRPVLLLSVMMVAVWVAAQFLWQKEKQYGFLGEHIGRDLRNRRPVDKLFSRCVHSDTNKIIHLITFKRVVYDNHNWFLEADWIRSEMFEDLTAEGYRLVSIDLPEGGSEVITLQAFKVLLTALHLSHGTGVLQQLNHSIFLSRYC